MSETTTSKNIKDNPHKQHRERMRKRYIENGLSSFHEHEILEMLLFYSIPVVNTNPLAHNLISEFGSLKNVLDAPIEALSKVDGLGEKSALFISFLNDVFSLVSKSQIVRTTFSNYDAVGEYLVEEFKDSKKEHVIALLLDAKDGLISKEHVGEGDFKSSDVDVRGIMLSALTKNAAKLILAHNHVNGNPYPSINDKAVTLSLSTLLNQVGIEFVEHYIVCDGVYSRIKNS